MQCCSPVVVGQVGIYAFRKFLHHAIFITLTRTKKKAIRTSPLVPLRWHQLLDSRGKKSLKKNITCATFRLFFPKIVISEKCQVRRVRPYKEIHNMSQNTNSFCLNYKSFINFFILVSQFTCCKLIISLHLALRRQVECIIP